MSGKWSEVQPVNEGVKDICNKVKSDMQKMVPTTFKTYNPITFASLIVAGGTEYVVKVEVETDQCVHAMISATNSSGTLTLTVLRTQYPHTILDPLVPF